MRVPVFQSDLWKDQKVIPIGSRARPFITFFAFPKS